MKRMLTVWLAAAMLLVQFGLGAAAQEYVPGIYTGAAKGFGGTVTAVLTVDDQGIAKVELTGEGETPAIGGAALSVLAQQVQEAQNTEIDGVAGATVTGNAVKDAVNAALAQARGEQMDELTFVPGTYAGTAHGMWEPLTVEVTVDEKAIVSVNVTACADTPIVSTSAIKEVPARIVAEQSLAVDAASGATVTSNAILAAAKNALGDATDGMALLTAPLEAKEIPVLDDQHYDIVIVGGGGAGLTAAAQIGRLSDLSVLVLEKESWLGGATALSGGGISTPASAIAQLESAPYVTTPNGQPLEFTGDSVVEYFAKKTASLTERPEGMWINEELVRRVFDKAESFYPILQKEGLMQTMAISSKFFGDGNQGIGAMYDWGDYPASEDWGFWLTEFAQKYGAEIHVNAPVTSLIGEDGAVVGVTVSGKDGIYNVYAKKVILCTGGYSANREMLRETCSDVFPYIDEIFTFTTPGATGDAIEMVKPFDGAYTGYGLQTQFGVAEPYAFETKLGNEAYATHLWVDIHGNRFTEEGAWYYDKGDDFRKIDKGYGYAIFNAIESFSAPHGDGMTFEEWSGIMIENGWMLEADSVEELAEKLNMDAANVYASIDGYNVYANECANGLHTDILGMPTPVDQNGKLYALRVQMCVTDTLYGLKQDADFRVLNNSGEPIPNLYAAGTVGFGNYEMQKYYASTTAIAIAVYGGALAAEEAVEAVTLDAAVN